MKNKFFVICGSVVVVALVTIIYISIIDNKPIQQNSQTSNSQNSEKVEDTSKTVEITFEEAVKMKMLYGDMSQEAAQDALAKEENRILEELAQEQKKTSDKTIEEIKSSINLKDVIKYYSFVGEFTFPENTDFSVNLEAVIVAAAAADGDRYIDRVENISTKLAKGDKNTQWVQTASSSNIEINKTVARLATTGYFSIQNEKLAKKQVLGFESVSTDNEQGIFHSKTTYPTFNFRLEDVTIK